jgi:hypothetical protein
MNPMVAPLLSTAASFAIASSTIALMKTGLFCVSRALRLADSILRLSRTSELSPHAMKTDFAGADLDLRFRTIGSFDPNGFRGHPLV